MRVRILGFVAFPRNKRGKNTLPTAPKILLNIVEAALQRIHQVGFKSANQPVLPTDAARPEAGEVVFEKLRLARALTLSINASIARLAFVSLALNNSNSQQSLIHALRKLLNDTSFPIPDGPSICWCLHRDSTSARTSAKYMGFTYIYRGKPAVLNTSESFGFGNRPRTYQPSAITSFGETARVET